jgi:hypothetical protein
LTAVAELRHALDAEAEGEAGVLLGVVADVREDARIDHARAAELDPAGALAQAAAVPRPRQKAHCMSTSAPGSTKGKYDARKRMPRPLPKKRPMKCRSTPLQIAHADAHVDDEASSWLNMGECVASSSRR